MEPRYIELLRDFFATGRSHSSWRQLRAQFRPFVITDLEIQPPFFQIAISNMGTTMAREVRFEFDPPLASSMPPSGIRPVPIADASLFKDGIPSLPPGKRIAVLFDDDRTRTPAGLPEGYQVTVRYRGDPFKRRLVDTIVLDLGMYRQWGAINRKDVHDVAKKIEKLTKVVAEKG